MRVKLIVCGAFLLHCVLLAGRGALESATVDERQHLEAGISHYRHGGFQAYRQNPPMVRMVAAIPLVSSTEALTWQSERSLWRLTLARWVCIPFSVLGAAICFCWGRELFGPSAGLFALVLWCSCPNVLGHASLITPDVGGAALALAGCYAFWHWLRAPDWIMTVLAGIVLGFAQLAKTTNILLFVLLAMLWGLWRIGAQQRQWVREAPKLAAMFLLAVLVLNAGYGFEGSFTRLGDFRFVSKMFGGQDNQGVANRFAGSWLGSVPVPLPQNYVLGVDLQRSHFEAGPVSYLRGELRNEGWWYYYIYALLVKVPVGTWLLALLAIFVALEFRVSAGWRNELMLLAPLFGYLAFVSSQTGFNHHLRYVMPVFPFAFIWISRLAASSRVKVPLPAAENAPVLGEQANRASLPPAVPATQRRIGWCVVSVLTVLFLGWSIYSSLRVYPHSLSYFNELAGGPLNGPKHLLDSNIDWGQDVLFLKKWLDEHPEAKPMQLAYFGSFEPWEIYPQHFKPAPSGFPKPGWYAISVNYLYGYPLGGKEPDTRYVSFQHFQPVAYAGYSIYIYHITEASLRPKGGR